MPKIGTGLIVTGAGSYSAYVVYKQQHGYQESRKFQKFLEGHYVPNKKVNYEIDRAQLITKIKEDILLKAEAPRVVNIVGTLLFLQQK